MQCGREEKKIISEARLKNYVDRFNKNDNELYSVCFNDEYLSLKTFQ